MILCLSGVLDRAALRRLRTDLSRAHFVDGRRTAGWHARDVKRNAQLKPGAAPRAAESVARALQAHEVFQAAARPHRLGPVLFNRYAVGMRYGAHVDDAIMRDRDGASFRSDLSFTLFLSDPADYDGGALVIADAGGERSFRLAAGDALVYPSTTLHRVDEVTRGVRLAAVGWVQSLVPEADRREILFDLDVARRAMFSAQGRSEAFDLVSKSHANLLRLWSQL